MDCIIEVGIIKPDKLKTWNENNDPFDILSEAKNMTAVDWTYFFDKAKIFTDEVQIDWGSTAYKATKDQLREFVSVTNCLIEGLEELPDDNLGVVFIEMS